MVDPRDDYRNKPAWGPTISVGGDGPPPRKIRHWDHRLVVYRELLFNALPDEAHPRGWWSVKIWTAEPDASLPSLVADRFKLAILITVVAVAGAMAAMQALGVPTPLDRIEITLPRGN